MQRVVLLAGVILVALSACKKESTTEVPQAPDTTSHAYQWQEWTMGNDPQSSSLSDVAIVHDTLVYAGGAIFLKDSTTGQVEEQPHNLLKWTGGASWTPYKIWYLASCSSGGQVAFEVRALWPVAPEEILAAIGGPEIARWDGTHVVNLTCAPSLAIQKLWASSNRDVLAVGNRGKIIHYDGTSWTLVPSPTTTDLIDVCGKGPRRWACGYTPTFFHSVLLRSDDRGASWRVLWQADSTQKAPLGLLAMSLWASEKYLYIAADGGIYRLGIDDPLDAEHLTLLYKLSTVPLSIRGTADNNIGLTLGDGSIWHFNGATWHEITPEAPFEPLYALSVSEHMIVGAGFDANSILSKGRVVIARRM